MSRTTRIVTPWHISLFFILHLLPASLLADDCMVTTDARQFMAGAAQLASHQLDTTDGQYTALLKNGDIIIARFAQCDLGLTAHYFSVKDLNANELEHTLKMFLGRLLSSDDLMKKFGPDISRFSSNNKNGPLSLPGNGDAHQLSVKPSVSPLYQLHIQYEWIPPEY